MNMESFKKSLFACFILAWANATSASTDPTLHSQYKFSFFGGAGIAAASNIQAVKTYTVNGVNYPYDEILVSSNFNAGGNIGVSYDINPYFSLAAEYINLGKQDFGITYQTELGLDAIGATFQNKICALEAIASLPRESFAPYIKAGFARYNMRWYHYSDVPGVSINQDVSVTTRGNAVVYGVGVKFPVYHAFSAAVFFDGIYSFNNTAVATSVSQYYSGINLFYQITA